MKKRAVLILSLWTMQLLMPAGGTSPVLAAEEFQPSVVEDPANAITLSLQDCVQAAIENNLDLAVQKFVPRRSETVVTLEKAVFDPLLTGSATSRADELALTAQEGTPLTFDRKRHEYNIGFEDPLITGGNYRFDINTFDQNAATDFVTVDLMGNPIVASTDSSEVDVNLTLTVTQPLLRNFGRDVNRWRIVVARNDLGASESQFRQTLIDTVAASEQAYWELNFTLMELKTVQASLKQARDFLEQNKIKVRVGTLAPIEITQAEAQVAEREQDLIVAEFAVLAAEDELRRVMGVVRDPEVWERPIRPSDSPPLEETSPDLKEAQMAAEANRPDLEQARLSIASRETELHYRKNQKRWGLDFEGALGYLGVDFDDSLANPMPPPLVNVLSTAHYSNAIDVLRDGDLPSWRLSLLLSVPVGNRAAVASYIDAKYAVEQVRHELRQVEQFALVEVRNAVRRVATDLKRVNAGQVNTRLQREKLEAEQKKFENGMSTSFEVLTFQTDLARAETLLNRAIVDYNKSLVELERVKGTLLQARGILIPGQEGEAEAEMAALRSAALRALWKKPSAMIPTSAMLRSEESISAVTLPARFEFKGGRLAGVGGDGLVK
jgi:outer membrane protein TolC